MPAGFNSAHLSQLHQEIERFTAAASPSMEERAGVNSYSRYYSLSASENGGEEPQKGMTNQCTPTIELIHTKEEFTSNPMYTSITKEILGA